MQQTALSSMLRIWGSHAALALYLQILRQGPKQLRLMRQEQLREALSQARALDLPEAECCSEWPEAAECC